MAELFTVVARACWRCGADIPTTQTPSTCFRCAFAVRSERLGNWTEYGLRAQLFLLVALVVGRGFEYYRTPWLVVLAPLWMPLAFIVLSVAQLFVRFGLWLLFRWAFPWSRW